MSSKEIISPRQFSLLLLWFLTGTSILLTPGNLVALSKNSGWICVILLFPFGMLYLRMLYSLGKIHGNIDFLQINIKVFGKIIGRLITFLVSLFALISASTVLWVIGDFIALNILYATPVVYIHILFMLAILAGVYYGIETIGRTAEIFTPWILSILLFIAIFSIPQIKWKRTMPFLQEGVQSVLQGSYYELTISTLPLITILFFFFHSVEKERLSFRNLYVPYFLYVLIITVITFLVITVLGANIGGMHSFPTYMLSKNIKGAVERVEVLVAISWILTIYFKMNIYFFAACKGIANTLSLQSYRSIVLPVGIITLCLSVIIYPDNIYADNWNQSIWLYYVTTFGLLYPILLWVISVIKHKRASSGNQKTP
ncbi:endospore germination permease [Pontibacillus salicampi]|uniref:Endospore germination permease n=1 Tax=Pontibacillus salicampi TaxID=1449801 RepID=A0ABV6LPK3_9BACI